VPEVPNDRGSGRRVPTCPAGVIFRREATLALSLMFPGSIAGNDGEMAHLESIPLLWPRAVLTTPAYESGLRFREPELEGL
jgi:hypothetical protein